MMNSSPVEDASPLLPPSLNHFNVCVLFVCSFLLLFVSFDCSMVLKHSEVLKQIIYVLKGFDHCLSSTGDNTFGYN